MSAHRVMIERLHEAFNVRRFEVYAELLDEDVLLVISGRSLRGAGPFCDSLVASVNELPGVRMRLERVISDVGDTIVYETRYFDSSTAPGAEPATWGSWRLPVTHCVVCRIVDGRITECRVYVGGEPPDDESGRDATRWPGVDVLLTEQAALRRVATLVARGADQTELLDAVVIETAELFGEEVWLSRLAADDTRTVLAAHGPRLPDDLVGTTVLAEHRIAQALRSGRPARVDDLGGLTSPGAQLACRLGFVAAVAVPLVVQGTVWGDLMVLSSDALVDGIEERLVQFGDLAATAIANAQSRADLQLLADEQAALRRVATLVARGASQGDVFDAIVAEAAGLLGESTWLWRAGAGDEGVFVAQCGPMNVDEHAGTAVSGDAGVLDVLRSGRPVRVDDFAALTGSGADRARRAGVASTVAAPLVVQGVMWGVLVVGSRMPLAPGIEDRLAQFAELAATAIANAQAHAELTLLAEEQAALRRVAELVARGAATQEVFDRVTIEASRLLDDAPNALERYERSGTQVVIVSECRLGEIGPADDQFVRGGRVPVVGDTARARVWRTQRAARIDDYEGVAGRATVRQGTRAVVAAPVVVEGRLWGVLTSGSAHGPLPAGTEERLTRFCELIAAAIANAESRAELTASRARIVASGDEARRRLARDVHDGAQQRLVHAVITLKQAQSSLKSVEGPAAGLVDESLRQARSANEHLRELAHGIMPAALHRGGLRAGIDSLRAHVPLVVQSDVLAERLPEPVETTAYFVIAEALTNVVKHAAADRAQVRAVLVDDRLQVEVSDDGCGGADTAAGSGLVGLGDRVAAAGGAMSLTSRPGQGTTLSVTLPVGGLTRP